MSSQDSRGSSRSSDLKSTLLLILCWVVYTCSYIGKYSYAANIKIMGDALKIDDEISGLVSTFFFFAYAIGQIINGIMCKKYNIKYVVFTCLLVASTMNICVGFCPTDKFELLKWFWLINGIAMSFLWPTLIRLLSETMKKARIDRAIVVMGTTVAAGTCIIYGISALFAYLDSINIGDYRWSFALAAILLCSISIIWFFSFNPLVKPLRKECKEEEKALANAEIAKEDGKSSDSAISITKKVLVFLICTLAFLAVVNNYVKDGLTAWTPDILGKFYEVEDWQGILLTLLEALVAIPGTVIAVKLYNIIKKYIGTCTAMFATAAALMGLVILFTQFQSAFSLPITVASFSLIVMLMSGIDNIIVGMVPLQLKSKVNSGKLAGILNGFCYLGSTIAMYSLGAISKMTDGNWTIPLVVLLSLVIVAVVIGIIYSIVSRKHSIK